MNRVWCHMQLICCICLILMFIGGATEQAARESCVQIGMSGHQIRNAWGRPNRITTSDALFPQGCPTPRICIWTYQEPYRLVVFKDDCAVRVFLKEEKTH